MTRQNTIRITNKQTGLTLIELIMTIIIAAIILTPVAIIVFESVRNTFMPEYYTIASSLLKGKLDEVTNLRFVNVTNQIGSFTGKFSGYSYNISYYYVNGSSSPLVLDTPSPPTDYKRVTIAISRLGYPNVKVTTLVTNN